MQTYKFTAVNDKGHTISGELEAENENDLDESLKRLGLDIRSFSEYTESQSHVRGKVKLEDLATLCKEFGIALRANIPIEDSIKTIRFGCTSAPIASALSGIYSIVRQGHSLSEGFACYPQLFSNFFITLIALGEKTGRMGEVFTLLEDYLKWIIALRRRFIKVVRYPLASACFTTGVIWMLLIHIVCFALYRHYTLPDFLVKVLPFSNFVIYFWPFILFGPVVSIYSTLIVYRHVESIAYQLDRFFLSIPLLGDLITKFNTARFVYFFSFMYSAGVGIEEGLKDAEKTISNRVLRESFSKISGHIGQGMSLSDAVTLSRAFPPMVAQAFRLGETTGDISGALQKVTHLYRQEANDAIDAFADYLRYALLILSGIFLAT